jgi:hypothetical protein
VSSDGRYGYCKIFVKHDEPSTMLARLAAVFGVTPERRSLPVPGLILDVRPNPDGDPAAGDDFVRWPVTVEAEADDPDSPAVVVPTVSQILTDLWGADIPAVAACDFEDELPWQGGIQRIDR